MCNLNLTELSGFERTLRRVNVENGIKFLNSQNQMKRLTFFMANVAFWVPILKMKNLEYLELSPCFENSFEQLITITNNQKNTNVKSLKLDFSEFFSNLEFCQSILKNFTGLIYLDLR